MVNNPSIIEIQKDGEYYQLNQIPDIINWNIMKNF